MSRSRWIFIVCLIILMLLLCALLVIQVVILSFGTSSDCDIKESSQFFLNNTNQSDIILTFTTMPDRMNKQEFKKAVSSMLLQSRRPKQIRANIPYVLKKTGKTYDIPEWLLNSPVTIYRAEDQGPATKYLSTLQDFKGTKQRILICDDDVVFDQDTVKEYEKAIQNFPESAVAAFGAEFKRKVNTDNNSLDDIYFQETECDIYAGKIHPIMAMFFPHKKLESISEKINSKSIDMVYGAFTYCIAADMVNPDELALFDTMPKEAYFVDDVVMSANLSANNISKKVIHHLPVPRITYSSFLSSVFSYLFHTTHESEALSQTVNVEHKNDNVMIRHFKHVWGTKPF